jgi:hypothetical protein
MDSARALLRCAWVGSAGDEPAIVVYDAQTPLARVSNGLGLYARQRWAAFRSSRKPGSCDGVPSKLGRGFSSGRPFVQAP